MMWCISTLPEVVITRTWEKAPKTYHQRSCHHSSRDGVIIFTSFMSVITRDEINVFPHNFVDPPVLFFARHLSWISVDAFHEVDDPQIHSSTSKNNDLAWDVGQLVNGYAQHNLRCTKLPPDPCWISHPRTSPWWYCHNHVHLWWFLSAHRSSLWGHNHWVCWINCPSCLSECKKQNEDYHPLPALYNISDVYMSSRCLRSIKTWNCYMSRLVRWHHPYG